MRGNLSTDKKNYLFDNKALAALIIPLIVEQLLAVLVGMFQGAIQALSRSYFAKIIPAEKAGEYFGIYDICGKGASFMGTILVSAVSQITGSVNLGVGALSVMFLAGFFLFLKADKTEKSEEEQENPGVLFQQPGLGQ